MRQIILDTETTGLKPSDGHRVIEIACVELVNRQLTGKSYHHYLCPDRTIDAEAVAVHGITEAFLADKPRFKDISGELIEFLADAELVIHNAPFDVGFINSELQQTGHAITDITWSCKILDTLVLARKKHPGQPNSLDALCKRYKVDHSKRDLHGALLDAHLLAQVYLSMTGGQTSLWGEEEKITSPKKQHHTSLSYSASTKEIAFLTLKTIKTNEAEYQAHKAQLEMVQKASGGNCLWEK